MTKGVQYCHLEHVHSFAWNMLGSLIVTAAQDKRLRVIDARTGKLRAAGDGHQGGKPSKVVWCGDKDLILATGFTRSSWPAAGHRLT